MRSILGLPLLALAACHSPAATSTTPVANAAPARLGQVLSQAELTARLADHRLHRVEDVERLPDAGGNTAMTSPPPGPVVEGNLVTAMDCRPGGMGPVLVADAHHFYIYFASDDFHMHPGPHGEALATPSTYCSFVRFRVRGALTYGGELKIVDPPQPASR